MCIKKQIKFTRWINFGLTTNFMEVNEFQAIVPDRRWSRPATQESMEALSRVQNIIGDFDTDHTMKYYDEWSKHYEKDLQVLDYKVPDFMASKLREFVGSEDWDTRSFQVLDIGAGTGQMGIALLKLGMKGSMDALDGNTKMLEKAQNKKLYRNHVRHLLTDSSPMPFPSNAYDVVVCCCAMVPALIQPECLPDMARVVKSGGRLYFTTRATDGNSAFRDRVDVQLAKMTESGLVEKTAEDVIPQYSWPVDENEESKHCISAVAICLNKLKPSEL